MFKYEFPLSYGTVELTEEDLDRMDSATLNIEAGDWAAGIKALGQIGKEWGSFIGANTDLETAIAVHRSLVSNLKPIVAEAITNGYEGGIYMRGHDTGNFFGNFIAELEREGK